MSDSFENLLARTEHGTRRRPAVSRCRRARGLPRRDAHAVPERAGVEAHAADCARCALQLATLVRLEDESGSPQHAPAPRWWPRLAWLVPAATAVLVVAIYVALPSRDVARGAGARPGRHTSDDRPERKETEAAQAPAVRDRLAARRPPVPPMSMPAPVAKSVPSATPAPAPPMPDARHFAEPGERTVAPRDQEAVPGRTDHGRSVRAEDRDTSARIGAAGSAAVVRESVAQPREEDVAMLGAREQSR